MSNILIYDVAAESGGALSVLREYYQKAVRDNNRYYFVVSVAELDDTDNVAIIKCPWVKRSWLHRLFMDLYYIKRLIKKHNINEVLSLQNHSLRGINVKQAVYVHNAIPFCEHKFNLIHEPYLWIYQNIIGSITKKSLKNADNIIVQTQWMKNAINRYQNIPMEKIIVEPIELNVNYEPNRTITKTARLFYPATPLAFKNHSVIVEACRLLSKEERLKIEIFFTFTGNESQFSSRIKKVIENENLPIRLIGVLDATEMREYYKSSVLIFASYVETVGLPLIEAQYYDAPIIVADLEYARCSIGAYDKVTYFAYDDSIQLSHIIRGLINEFDNY